MQKIRTCLGCALLILSALVLGYVAYRIGISYRDVGQPVKGGSLGCLAFVLGMLAIANCVNLWVFDSPPNR